MEKIIETMFFQRCTFGILSEEEISQNMTEIIQLADELRQFWSEDFLHNVAPATVFGLEMNEH